MDERNRIGLLEDDPDQSRILTHWLNAAGYQVKVYPDAESFRSGYLHGSADLLILDWNLPEESGLSVLRWLRASGSVLPVLFLTARHDEADVVVALQEGADDYVGKPARHDELLARVKALLRRTAQNRSEEDDIAPYRIDVMRRRIERDGQEITLTDREFDLALFLFRRHGRVISRETLLEHIWNISGEAPTRTVDTHVSRLRKKLELSGEHGWRLSAVYQHGYRLERA